MDDLEQVRDKRRPQGVTSPIKDAAKPAKPPTTTPRPPKADAAKPKNDMKLPASGLAKVTGKDKKPGVRRNVGSGREKKANVTREQLQKTGLTLRDYLNFMDKNNRRPTKADAAAAKSITEGFKKKKAVKKAGGGMMKSKMKAKGMKAGGKMKTKGYMAGGLKDAPEGNTGLKKLPKQVRNKMGFKAKGGMMKTKGYAKGGMKSKGYAKGGKVRGAGIARKGVRPAKMR
jgi:type VI protein secretion system component VasK